MTKEQFLKALEEKYIPLIEEVKSRELVVFQEKKLLEDEYSEKQKQAEDYFSALENKERILNLIDNPPTI